MKTQTEELINRLDPTKIKCEKCNKYFKIEEFKVLFELDSISLGERLYSKPRNICRKCQCGIVDNFTIKRKIGYNEN